MFSTETCQPMTCHPRV